MPAAKPYHHGNLRQSLLDGSFALIRENGIASLTLRQLATRTGVSHTAAYRHFRDKNQLLAALAQPIFKRIADRITYYALKGFTPKESLELAVIANLKYFLDRPDEFRLILALDLSQSPAANLPFEALLPLVAACKPTRTDPATLAQLLLTHIHGTADLAFRNSPGIPSRKRALELTSHFLKLFTANL